MDCNNHLNFNTPSPRITRIHLAISTYVIFNFFSFKCKWGNSLLVESLEQSH
jgi:hypothetical protein